MNRLTLALLVIAAFIPNAARADRRELYVLAEVSPELLRLDTPVAGTKANTSSLGADAGATVYYGITNRLHLGAAFHYALTRNVAFKPTTVTLRDGSSSSGTVYEDTSSFSLTGVAAYRFDSGNRVTPIAQLEGGFASLSYTRIAHIPSSVTASYAYPDNSETVLELRAQVRGEARFTDHLVASVGVGAVVHPGALNPWSLYAPLSVGYIW